MSNYDDGQTNLDILRIIEDFDHSSRIEKFQEQGFADYLRGMFAKENPFDADIFDEWINKTEPLTAFLVFSIKNLYADYNNMEVQLLFERKLKIKDKEGVELKCLFKTNSDPNEIGYALRLMRESRDLTQADVAYKLGKSSKAVQQAESGRASPTARTLQEYADVLGYEFEIGFVKLDQ